MFTSRSIQSSFIQRKNFSIDYILLFLFLLGVISMFAMYSTEEELLYHTKSHIVRFFFFFYFL